MHGWWFIRLNHEFVFLDQELQIISILYGWSGIYSQLGLSSFMFSYVTSSKLIIFFYHFVILLHLISSFWLTRSVLVPYTFDSIESIDCIILSSFEFKAVLLIVSVKTFCLSLSTVFLILICCFLWIFYDFL